MAEAEKAERVGWKVSSEVASVEELRDAYALLHNGVQNNNEQEVLR